MPEPMHVHKCVCIIARGRSHMSQYALIPTFFRWTLLTALLGKLAKPLKRIAIAYHFSAPFSSFSSNSSTPENSRVVV